MAEMPVQPSPRPVPPPSRRRDKPQLSCNLCRKRKLRCDRAQPCETCVRRGLSLSCTYVQGTGTERSERPSIRPTTSADITNRIAQLEQLVVLQMTSSKAAKSSETSIHSPNLSNVPSPANQPEDVDLISPQNPSQLLGKYGRMSTDDTENSYAESSHWTSILDGITELKDSFDHDRFPSMTQESAAITLDVEGVELLTGRNNHVTKQDILAAIPPRATVDRLIAKCFSSVETAPLIIHTQTFLHEYEEFWKCPTDMSIMWVGLLFAMMCLAVIYQPGSPNEPIQLFDSLPAVHRRTLILSYRQKVSQCLVLGQYTKSPTHTIETLLFYFYVEFLGREDTETSIWLLLGIVFRLALRMGFHRDPSDFPGISPFRGEMRRRIWAVIAMMDVTASAQVGIPRSIIAPQSNTAEPRNLLNDDLYPEMAELPAARPDTFQTPIQYFVVKNRLLRVFGMISDATTLTTPMPYAEILKLDSTLHDAHKKIPSWLEMRSMTKSIMDSPEVIVQRMYIAQVFHKARCVLHRPYLFASITDRRFVYSRTVCIESALELLYCQYLLNQETQRGGRLWQDRGIISSLVKTDFLLATTILCVDLDQTITAEPSAALEGKPLYVSRKEDVIQALYNAYMIWLQSSETSREAQQATEVIRIVLAKAQRIKTRQVANKDLDDPRSQSASGNLATPTLTPESTSMQGSTSDKSVDTLPTEVNTLSHMTPSAADPFIGFTGMDFDLDNWDPGFQNQIVDETTVLPPTFPRVFQWILPGS